jgi:hypothetical protein
VNGVSTAGSCAASAASGTFTTVGENLNIVTVEVTSSTAFTDTADATPSFADVCVGTQVSVAGTNTSGTVAASAVSVLAPKPVSVEGVVTSVNGASTAGTCGVSGASGAFSYVGQRLHIVTVDVATSTAFTDIADATPSFADLCVGDHVKITGSFSSGALDATSVLVVAPRLYRTAGIVTSVNGSAASGSCGVAGASGNFTIVPRRHERIVTVDVATTTAFTDASGPTPSFAYLCVGNHVKALGT